MESIHNVLVDDSISETEKLTKVNVLLDASLEKNKDDLSISLILNIDTENIELKCDVLRKALNAANNIEESIKYFIEYFKKLYIDIKSHKLLSKLLTCIFEVGEEQNQIQNIVDQLGIETIDQVLLTHGYANSSKEFESILKPYLRCLSTVHQTMFFNHVFELSETEQIVELIFLTLENMDQAAVIHETSVFRAIDFWIYLTNCMINNKENEVTRRLISILQQCINLVKNGKLDLNFLSVEGDENVWNDFLTLMYIVPSGESGLIKPSLQLLSNLSLLHYFWQHTVYKMLIKHTPTYLKCTVLASVLKQSIKNEDIKKFFQLIFSSINEQNCHDTECVMYAELINFCENTTVENLHIILDELLNISWNGEFIVWNVLSNVLVDSKKNLMSFEYFPRILRLLESYSFDAYSSKEMEQISAFFRDLDNLNYWKLLRDSTIPFYIYDLPVPEKIKTMAILKLVELSNEDTDDFVEISSYLCFLRNIKITDLIKDYPLSIHVRMVIYTQLFNMNGYVTAQAELDQEKTVNDFYEYLLKYLNEENYIAYKELMLSFLDIMDRFMSFAYPKKACSEFINIILNPELYTKYQICCTLEVLRYVNYRFDSLSQGDIYKKIALKWKNLVLETEDLDICEQGLYFVFAKGQLNTEEYNQIAIKLLDKHFDDKITEEIFSSYLNADLMNVAFRRLKCIIENNPEKCEEYSKLFCEAVVSDKYVDSGQFSLDNEEVMFCYSTTKNLEYSIREVDFRLLDSDRINREIIIDLIMEIYLNILINMETKVYCLHTLLQILTRNSTPGHHPPQAEYFIRDVKKIMHTLKGKYAQNLKNDIIKLRIIQGLYLLIPFVMRDFNYKFKYQISKVYKTNIFKKFRNKLKRIAVGILVKESDNENNPTVRQICQLMYVHLIEQDGTFKEIKCILEKVKEQPDLAPSFMPLVYHAMPFCQFSRNEIEDVIESILVLSRTADNKLRIYAQLVLQRLHIVYKNKFNSFIEKYTSRLEQIDFDVETNKINIADILKTDYLFLKVLDPARDHAMETILYILPKLNQVDLVEWKDVMKYGLLWNSEINQFTVVKDNKETLKKSVEEFLEPPVPQKSDDYESYTAEDIRKIFKMSFERSKFSDSQ